MFLSQCQSRGKYDIDLPDVIITDSFCGCQGQCKS